MNAQRNSAAWLAVAIVAALCVIVCCWHRSVVGSQPAAPDTVRIVVHDTITITKPVAVSSKPIGITPVRLPVWVESDEPDNSDDSDSATVAVPIEQKVYADSNYRAVISGYMVSLDTMQVYPRTEYVRIKPPPAKPRRRGIGITAGYSITPRGLQPALTAGITYNFIVF